MCKTPTTPPSLDELAAVAVQLGRELNLVASTIYAGGSSHDFGLVDRMLRRLAEREPFDPRDEVSFQALRGILDAELAGEIAGTERRFVETRYDKDGQHGEVRDFPIYSDRGRALVQVARILTRFITARDVVLDRVTADCALTRLLAT